MAFARGASEPHRPKQVKRSRDDAFRHDDDDWTPPPGLSAAQSLLIQLADDERAPLQACNRCAMRHVIEVLENLSKLYERGEEAGECEDDAEEEEPPRQLLTPQAKWSGPRNAPGIFRPGSALREPAPPRGPPPRKLLKTEDSEAAFHAAAPSDEVKEEQTEKAEENERMKEDVLDRVVKVLQQGEGFMTVSHMANDHAIRKIKFSRGGLRSILEERPDLISIVEIGNQAVLCFAGREADAEQWFSQKIAAVPPRLPHLVGDGPLYIDPGDLGAKKLESLYQNKMQTALKAGDIYAAEAMVVEAWHRNGVNVNAQKINWIIQAHARDANLAAATEWFERMEPEFGVRPTERTFAHVLDGFAKACDPNGANVWLARMKDYGLTPDIRSLNGMIKACCRSLHLDISFAEAWVHHIFDFEGLKPDSFTYGNMVLGCAKRRDPMGAEKWFNLMLGRGFPATNEVCTFALDAAACTRREDADKKVAFIRRILGAMHQAGISPDRQCWSALLRAIGKPLATQMYEEIYAFPAVQTMRQPDSWTAEQPESCTAEQPESWTAEEPHMQPDNGAQERFEKRPAVFNAFS
eukprot:TRINITY_DN20149_c0_g1_i1.p1 TRINITY_DN20149_c0_g1~~TRINITY_DN20149_c0_g1_i1.p1  ORF type:complete len:580 (-),score=75.64 TRINITY_DN20149_c0_g1_i1:230-1969(-)